MKALQVVLIAGLAVTIIFFSFSVFISSRNSSAMQDTWAAMKTVELECPAGTEAHTERWGKAGYSRICAPLKDGKWEAWEDGYRHISGNYRGGKKHGVWTFFNRDGSVFSVVEYQDGVEVVGKNQRATKK